MDTAPIWSSELSLGEAYLDFEAYLHDLRLLTALYLQLTLDTFWRDGQPMLSDEMRECFVTSTEASLRIRNYPGKAAQADPMGVRRIRTFQARIREKEEATPLKDLIALHALEEAFGLNDFERFAVMVSCCCEQDRSIEQIFSTLSGDSEIRHPTRGTLSMVYGIVHSQVQPLNSACEGLFVRQTGRPMRARPLILRDAVLRYLMNEEQPGGRLASVSEELRGCAYPPDFLEQQTRILLTAFDSEMQEEKDHPLMILYGADGSGKRTTLRWINEREGIRFLLMNAQKLLELPDRGELVMELVMAVVFYGFTPCFTVTGLSVAQLAALQEDLLKPLRAWHRPILFLTDQLKIDLRLSGYTVCFIPYAYPTAEQAVALWGRFAAALSIPDGLLQYRRLGERYRLTPGRIAESLRSALLMSRTSGKPLDEELVVRAVQQENTGHIGTLAQYIESDFTWDDLCLDEKSKQLLRTACNRILCRGQVQLQLDRQESSIYGGGISILLYGSPGTGKTMSAQVVSRELGLPLYRINLSQIISKYIGETAQNLDRIFADAQNSNLILFFDEADSLFATRTAVSTSNDRYANSETSYLLQKMEEYPGVCILATNLFSNFDEAFRRRISYVVKVNMPGEEQRLSIWKKMFPSGIAVAADIDFPLLAGALEISGSVIKSAAVQAVFLASEENAAVTMKHIVRALMNEYEKLSMVFPQALRYFVG